MGSTVRCGQQRKHLKTYTQQVAQASSCRKYLLRPGRWCGALVYHLPHASYRHIDVTRESRHRTHLALWHCAVQGGIGGRYILHLVIRFRYMHSNFTDSKIKDWYVLYLCQRHVVDFRRRDAPRESHNLAPQPRLSDQRTPRASRRATCARR